MKAIQSIILGEPDKDKPTVVPPAKEEVKPVAQPSSSIMPEPTKEKVVQPSNAIMPDPVAADVNGEQPAGGVGQSTQGGTNEQPMKPFTGYQDVIEAQRKSNMPTEEELKKERKRERARSIIAAIADGTSAIANLYFVGKGAKNVVQTSMSAANAKRYQDILDKRKNMQDKWDEARTNASIRDMEQTNRMEVARIEQKHREGMMTAKSQADVDAMNKKYANDLALLQQRNEVLVKENEKKRAHETAIADARNAASIRVAQIGASKSSGSGAKKDGKKNDKKEVKHPKLRYDGPNGATKYYDLNDDVQVAKMYNEGLKSGYFKEKEGKQPTVKQMRDIIVGSTGRWKEGNSANLDGAGAEWSLNGNDTGSWSLKQ